MAVDATGVGAPVLDMMRNSAANGQWGCDIWAVMITGGEQASAGMKGRCFEGRNGTMIFDSIRRGGNARLEPGALQRAGIRVNGPVLAGLKGVADVQERGELKMLILRRRMEAQDLLRRREMEKRR